MARFLGRQLAYTYEVTEPLQTMAIRRANRKDLRNLKAILEAG